ncbi:MAG: DUF86 domain-containing protein [Candidatus Omnitrophica bacterium]|nr:DUF86 domain-containing protein [Candidatus Omnitrophota bacterium]
MSKRPIPLLRDDMWEAIERIERYTSDVTRETFVNDEKTADAVVRNLEVVGEAAHRLPEQFKGQHAEITWPQIIGLRHRIVHDYFGIDLALVWQILQQDLPAFKSKLRQLRSAA